MKIRAQFFEYSRLLALLLLSFASIINSQAQDTIFVFKNTIINNDYIYELRNDDYDFFSLDSCLKINTLIKKTNIFASDTGVFNIYAFKGTDTIVLNVVSSILPEFSIEFSPIVYNRKIGWQRIDSLIIENLSDFKIIQFTMEYFRDYFYFKCDSMVFDRVKFLEIKNYSNIISETNKKVMTSIVHNGRIIFSNIHIRYRSSYFIIETKKILYTAVH